MAQPTKKIEVNDVVYLKSGGPAMTVLETNDLVTVTSWKDTDDRVLTGTYATAGLSFDNDEEWLKAMRK